MCPASSKEDRHAARLCLRIYGANYTGQWLESGREIRESTVQSHPPAQTAKLCPSNTCSDLAYSRTGPEYTQNAPAVPNVPARIQEYPTPANWNQNRENLEGKFATGWALVLSAYGFAGNENLLSYFERSDKTSKRWKCLDAKAIRFWYRQSSSRLIRETSLATGVTIDSPLLQYPGDILVILDTVGKLMAFHSMPEQIPTKAETARIPDWEPFLVEAGLPDLELSQWKSVDPESRPGSYTDYWAAWEATLPYRPDAAFHIEAAAAQGKPVGFEIAELRAGAKETESVQTRTLSISAVRRCK